MTGKGILDGMQGRDKKDREKAAKKATRIARAEKAEKAEATRAKQSTSGLITPVRLHPRVRFQFTGNVTDRDLEIDRDMEHESDTDHPLINKRYLNNEHSN